MSVKLQKNSQLTYMSSLEKWEKFEKRTKELLEEGDCDAFITHMQLKSREEGREHCAGTIRILENNIKETKKIIRNEPGNLGHYPSFKAIPDKEKFIEEQKKEIALYEKMYSLLSIVP